MYSVNTATGKWSNIKEFWGCIWMVSCFVSILGRENHYVGQNNSLAVMSEWFSSHDLLLITLTDSKSCPHPVWVNVWPGRVRRRGHVEAPRHQVLLGVHQVIQVLLIQEALKELAVVGAGQLHAVVPLCIQHTCLCCFYCWSSAERCWEAPTWMTRYLCGSRAIRQNSAASSLNLGLLSASIIQPEERKRK